MDKIEQTKSWINKIVIGLNLCPFAAHPFRAEKIKYRLEETDDIKQLTEALVEELLFLKNIKSSEVETSFIIHPNVLLEFLDYNDYLSVVEIVLKELELEGIIQVASFHPDYQFAGEAKDAPSNYVTRSPYPMLHLLRESSVTKAIESHPSAEQIPFDNIKTMNELGLENILKLKNNK